MTRDLVVHGVGDDPICTPPMDPGPTELKQCTHKQTDLLWETDPFSRGAFPLPAEVNLTIFQGTLEMMEEQRGASGLLQGRTP